MTNFESECARTVALAGCRPLALAVSKYFTGHLPVKYVHVHSWIALQLELADMLARAVLP